MAHKSEPEKVVDAVGTVYKTLAPLDEETRVRVLASVSSLLGTHVPAITPPTPPAAMQSPITPPPSGQERLLSLNELINEKQPVSTSQYIVLFAFYREKVEGKPRFSRVDIRDYFPKAKVKPSSNFDREFIRTVTLGWIHEDGAESYITTKGLEAAESGFGGKGLPRGIGALRKSRSRSTKKKSKKQAEKKPAKNRASKSTARKPSKNKRRH